MTSARSGDLETEAAASAASCSAPPGPGPGPAGRGLAGQDVADAEGELARDVVAHQRAMSSP